MSNVNGMRAAAVGVLSAGLIGAGVTFGGAANAAIPIGEPQSCPQVNMDDWAVAARGYASTSRRAYEEADKVARGINGATFKTVTKLGAANFKWQVMLRGGC